MNKITCFCLSYLIHMIYDDDASSPCINILNICKYIYIDYTLAYASHLDIYYGTFGPWTMDTFDDTCVRPSSFVIWSKR